MSGRVVVVPVVVLLWFLSSAAGAQVMVFDTVADAQRLRDGGNLIAAAEVLRVLVAQKPEDGEAARLLAQTLYWLKDLGGARAAYEAAIARHREDTTVRLQYARMLAETGEPVRARALLLPLLGIPATRADAATLLGLLAYWSGDYAAARSLFVTALQANPNQEEARRPLQDIRTVSAPWVRMSSVGWHDNQPLDRLGFELDAGWFVRPLTEVTARFQPTQYRLGDVTSRISVAEVGLSHYVAPSRLELEGAGGTVRRSQGSHPLEWMGRASLGVRLPQHVTLRGRIARAPYFHTTASLDTPVTVQTMAGLLQLNQKGWLGEAAYQRERYPDDNATRTAYGWILAPLSHQRGGGVQAGYAFSYSDADVTRFVLDLPTQPFPPGDPRFSTIGHYAPYYTPSRLRTHAAIGAVTLATARGVTAHVDGSYAVRATDNAPYFAAVNGQVVLSGYLRRFAPWRARGSVDIPLRSGLTLTPTGEIGRTSFYSSASAGLMVTYRFKAALVRPASGR